MKNINIILCLVIAGCSSGSETNSSVSNNPDPDGLVFTQPIQHYGVIDIDQFDQYIRAEFSKVEPAVSYDVLRGELNRPADSCDVNGKRILASGAVQIIDENPAPNGFSLNGESAGEIITFSSDGNSYIELAENSESNQGMYSQLTPSTTEQPGNLIVNIPGADYPAISGVELPAREPLALSRETLTGIVDPQTIENVTDFVFSWVPSTNPRSTIDLSIRFEAGGLPFQTQCLLEDDGEFQFPEQVQAELPLEKSISALHMRRQTLKSVSVSENAVLQVIVNSRIEF